MTAERSCEWLTVGVTTPSLVLGSDGRLRCANRESESLFDSPPGGLSGMRLDDLLGTGLAREVLATARRAIAEGRARFSVGMWRGYWARGRYTPLEVGGETMCISTADSWVSALGEPASGPGAVECDEYQFQDLGDLEALSAREVEVLWWLARDASVPEIARQFSRSTKTVESHIRSLSAKTGRSGRMALAQLAIERHIPRMTLEQVERVFGARAERAGAGGLGRAPAWA